MIMNYKELYNTKNVGDTITIPHSIMGDIDFIVIGKDHDGTGKLTLLSKNIIKIMAFDAIESSNTDNDRSKYGNNRYSMSNILQWMNSDEVSGWYSAKHSKDAIPNSSNVSDGYNPYDSIPGFLYGFNSDFKEALITVSKKTALNTNCDGGGYENVSSKMFLLSSTEVGLANENSIAEGSIYTWFSQSNTNSRRIAYPTSYAVSNSNYTNSSLTTSKGWYYWLRTPESGGSCIVRSVYSLGTRGINYAYSDCYGLRVACVI